MNKRWEHVTKKKFGTQIVTDIHRFEEWPFNMEL